MKEQLSLGGETGDISTGIKTMQMSSKVAVHDNVFVDGGQKGRAGAGARKDPVPAADQTQDSWRLEPHICRSCFSRLVSQDSGDGSRRWQCTNCGIEALGAGAAVLCCCGLTIRRPTKKHTSGHHLVDAGVRCSVNPNPRPDFPSLYVALEVEN